ncbi:MAG TPA: FG-GAP-like repeat-containing protein, partial [Pyrinomonadaceae bacterium]
MTISFCLAASIAGQAQYSPETERNTGAVDPLLTEFRYSRQAADSPAKDAPAFNASSERMQVSAGELDSTLNANIDSYPGNVRAMAVQPDGKIIAAGYFKTVNGVRHKSLARLNADNSIDPTFSANVNATILAVALQPDGKIIIGGAFNTVGSVNRSRIARLNADGSLDTTFNPGTGADNLVYAVAVQPDGKILVAGNFYGVNSTGNYCIARLNQDGSVDTSFVSALPYPMATSGTPFPPSIVYSLALQADGKIVIGGFMIKGYNGSVPVVAMVARLNPNGTFDTSFNPGTISSNLLKVAVQPDGKILIAGFFSTVGGVSRRYIARLNADGSLDESFNTGTGPNLPVYSMFLKPDGKILVGGNFSTINGVNRARVAQLNADGSLDDAFVPSAGLPIGTVFSVVSAPNGKILAGGSLGAVFNFNNDSIKFFNPDGSLDASARFNTTAVGGVRAVAEQPDGKIIIGGNFTRVGGIPRNNLARFNADGSLDESFGTSSVSSAGGQINSIVLQPDGKILIAGFNIAVGNSFGASVTRLNPDGTPDASFVQAEIPTGRGANAVALQPDGKIIVIWGYEDPNRNMTGGVVRLNADGSLDASFNSGVPGLLFNSVAVQPDGKILIAGPFSFGFINSQTGSIFFNGIVRLNSDGSRDTAFNPATTSDFEHGRGTQVFALALQPDGKILVGGSIFTSGRLTPTGVVRLQSNGALDSTFDSGSISGAADFARVEDILTLPDGKILIGGLFSNIGANARANVARLNADGSLDNSLNAATDAAVYDVAVQNNGKILLGGDFETVNGIARTSLARLLNEPSAQRGVNFDYDGDGKADLSVFRPSLASWFISNSSNNAFIGVQFGANGDLIAPADFDGDRKTDISVFRPSDGGWYRLNSSNNTFSAFQFGANGDLPVPGDFDGDGKADLTVY